MVFIHFVNKFFHRRLNICRFEDSNLSLDSRFSVSESLLPERVFCELARAVFNGCSLSVLLESTSRHSLKLLGWFVILLSYPACLLSCPPITYRAATPACNARYYSNSSVSVRRGFWSPLLELPEIDWVRCFTRLSSDPRWMILATCKKQRNNPYLSAAALWLMLQVFSSLSEVVMVTHLSVGS